MVVADLVLKCRCQFKSKSFKRGSCAGWNQKSLEGTRGTSILNKIYQFQAGHVPNMQGPQGQQSTDTIASGALPTGIEQPLPPAPGGGAGQDGIPNLGGTPPLSERSN